jgi:peptide/nickel transport system ATP-binding protein
MADPMLEIRGLRLSIRTDEGIARVLEHIDFTLERGRILGLVGESGCGKSTVIRARSSASCRQARASRRARSALTAKICSSSANTS